MKKHLTRRLTALMLSLVLCMGLAAPASALENAGSSNVVFEKVSNDVLPDTIPDGREMTDSSDTDYRDTDTVRVSIVLESLPAIYAASDVMNFAEDTQAVAYRELLEEEQTVVESEAAQKLGGELDVVWNLTLAVNVISANVQYGDIETIRAIDGVADVVIEQTYEVGKATVETIETQMATSGTQTGSSLAWAEGYTGAGSRIAVIDTGTDVEHQSFDAGAFEYAIEKVKAAGKSAALMTKADIAPVLAQLNAHRKSSGAAEDDFYVNAKIPFGYNYADGSFAITHEGDTQGEHGSHVAGIAAANRYIPDGSSYASALENVLVQGMAPDAQILTMKVFGKNGGPSEADYMAAIEDAIILKADSINISFGSNNPGMSANAVYQQALANLVASGVVISVSAGNSGYWAENAPYGYLYSDDVSMQTTGAPASYTNAFAVASVNNVSRTGAGSFLEFSGYKRQMSFTEISYKNAPIATLDTSGDASGTEYDFVMFDNTDADTAGESLLTAYQDVTAGKIVLIDRGDSTSSQKHDAVAEVGGAACIVVNDQAGNLSMDLSDSETTIPCVSITKEDGEEIRAAAAAVKADDGETILYYTGTVRICGAMRSYSMSSFSSWGIPGSLEMKPEIAAPGGSIYSVFGYNKTETGYAGGHDQYESLSGTSMAAPQIAGMAALLAQYWREQGVDKSQTRSLSQSLLMSTATPLIESVSNCYYSILCQGAGLANVNDAINAHSYIRMDEDANAGAVDGKVKVELGDDPERNGIYRFTYTLYNLEDEPAYYAFDTDVFTQGAFEYAEMIFLETSTVPLQGAAVSYTVSGGKEQGTPNAQTVLDALAAGTADTLSKERYDLDGDGRITSYDAHLILASGGDASGNVCVDAGGALTVTVTIDVRGCDFSNYPNGAYIEAYSYARELPGADGAEGTVHSIPVLGFYGNWSDPSMYDVGTLVEREYGIEKREAYLEAETGHETNYLTVRYDAGRNTPYLGNPMAKDAEYLEERNAFNSEKDMLGRYCVSVIRNAGNAIWQVTDAETDEVYYRSDDLGEQYSAFYNKSTDGAAWENAQHTISLNWQGTDARGEALPEGTQVNVSLVLAPEYYADDDGEYNWDVLTSGVLGKGAYLTTRMAIDNTAPSLETLTFADGTLTAEVSDNRYLAYAALYKSNGTKVEAFSLDQALANMGKSSSCAFSDLENGEYYIQLTDYARNQSTYRFVITENSEIDNTQVAPTKITLPGMISVAKGNTVQLVPEFEPWLSGQDVTWNSSAEAVATVDEDGRVTGVSAGTTIITAASKVDEAVCAACTVTVKSYDVTITGALQDENGEPQLFTWDLENDRAWTKTAELENGINSATLDLGKEMPALYQMDPDGYLYKIDPATGETLERSAGKIDYGAPVTDMTYGKTSSENLERDILFGIHRCYLLWSDPAMDNKFIDGWDMASYLSTYLGASEFTAVAWAGKDTNDLGRTVDVMYCLTDNGNIWVMEPDVETRSAALNYFSTNLSSSFGVTFEKNESGAYNCSMVMGEDGNFYVSCFTGDSNELYVLERNPAEDPDPEYIATYLGNTGEDVWPCSLLSVTKNDNETDEEGGELSNQSAFESFGDLAVMNVQAERLPLFGSDEHAADESMGVPAGSLNAVKVERSDAGTNPGGRNSVTLSVTADASTNGLIELSYDADVLTFVSATGASGVLKSVSDEDGKLCLAYASKSAYSGSAVTLTFRYDRYDCPARTEVNILTREECNALEQNEEETLTIRLRDSVSGGSTKPAESEEPEKPDDLPAADAPFADVSGNDWFAGDVAYVYAKGLMSGVSETEFAPNATLTRGMLVTILYRLSGEKSAAGAPFKDVAADQWYAEAVAWAAANGIVDGIGDGLFASDAPITREQIALILYRYAVYRGMVGVTPVERLSGFADADEISPYALAAMNWAVAQGLINGADGRLLPGAEASRAQIAAIIHRYCELMG